MGPLKVFISHSTRNDEKNRKILDQICMALAQNNDSDGLKVLVDKEMKPDTEWFPCLYEFMMECHAAVILLSKAALASEWVKNEAAVLCARRRSHSGFKLILVPLDDVNAGQLDNHSFFKAIRLSDFQTIPNCLNNDDIVNKVTESLQELKEAETPFDELTTLIREVIKKLKVDDETLERAWEAMKDNSQPGNDYADTLARSLLRDHKNIFSRLRKLFEKLAHILTKQQASRLIEIIKGHWVNPAAASLLRIAREDKQPVAINGILIADFTGHSYSRKAWPFPQEYTLVSTGSDRTLPEIRQTLLNTLGKSAVNPNRAETRVKSYKHPLLLVFPYPENSDQANNPEPMFPDKDLIKDIQLNFQNITVVLATGSQIPENLDYVLALEPPLEEDLEERQCDEYEDVMYYIANNIAD